jgi:hypothetical protein
MTKRDRREEMKNESSDRQVWGNIAKEEDELFEQEKLKGPAVEKEKANFGLSGALAKDEVTGNIYNGIVCYACMAVFTFHFLSDLILLI